jgi:hypothetical protein
MQAVPVGGVVAVGFGVAVGDIVSLDDVVAVGFGVAVGDIVSLDEAVADGDVEALAEWLAVLEVDGAGGLVAVGEAVAVLVVGVGVMPWLSTVKLARRMEVPPDRHVRTAVIVCRPSPSLAVSKGFAEPSLDVPAKSKGRAWSVRTGVPDFHDSSR